MNALPSVLVAPLIAALNHLLGHEPWARGQLAPFAGRVVRFDAAAFTVSLAINEHGLLGEAPRSEGNDSGDTPVPAVRPAVTLIVPMQQWPLVAADVASGGQAAAMKHVRIEGDAELANVVSALARSLRWDAEEDLSRAFRATVGTVIGGSMGGSVADGMAQRVVDSAQQVHVQALRAGRALLDNVTEYLLDEQPTLVRHAALDGLRADVAVLRDDLARLEKRLSRLDRLQAGPDRAGAAATTQPSPVPSSLPSPHR